MFRSDLVGDFNAGHQTVRHNDFAVVVNGCPGNFLPGKQWQLPLQLLLHRQCQCFAVRHQHGACQLVVLRLAQQVRRHMDGIALAVGNHQNFTGARDHVNGHLAKDLLLCLRHESVARSHDLVHLWDGLRAISQGSYGLGAAHFENSVHTGNAGRRQNGGVDFSVFSRRGHHDDLGTARDFCRDGVHQHCGRIGRRAAGDIDAHLLNGSHLLPQHHAGLVRQHEAVAHLPGVKRPDICRRLFQNFQKFRLHRGLRFLNFLPGNFQSFQLGLVKFRAVGKHRFIPVFPHIPENVGNNCRHIHRRGHPGKNFRIGHLPVFHNFDHFSLTCSSRRSRMALMAPSLN